ncbi:MAG: DoxX family membrane protein [candidate division KSB1 bacterium]|nr:DoxX family membrane protein [candidate division KSB1 bacterium]MDZ7367485.1 DoxX family membrane protein [candidate division KSB1 bacterium]
MLSFLKTLYMSVLNTTLRVLVGLIFVISGCAKFWNLYTFADSLSNYAVLPKFLVVPASVLIPLFEVASGLMILINCYLRILSRALIIMILGFTVVTFAKYLSGDVTDCGCFGRLFERKNDWSLVAENFLLILMLGFVSMGNKKMNSTIREAK